MNTFETRHDAEHPAHPAPPHRQRAATAPALRLPPAMRIDQLLSQGGLNVTGQRRRILGDLMARTDHPDVDMVLGNVRRTHPCVSVDTIYRNLNRFVEAGLIQRIPAPTRRARFDGNPRPHDHFVCDRCERIFDVATAPPETLECIKSNPSVHEVWTAQRVYLGRCTDCRNAEGPPVIERGASGGVGIG